MTALESLNLPEDIARGLSSFVDSAQQALGDSLISVVLFGSAAEGRLRATSDVNLMLVLREFVPARLLALSEALNLAHATMRLSAMLILESELGAAADSFAVKFADIVERHQVLAGRDVIAGLTPTRAAMRVRLRQILLNFVLRSREAYALSGSREERLATLVADAAAPLRSAAALIQTLRGQAAASPKEALEAIALDRDRESGHSVLANLSTARETGVLPPGVAEPTLLKLIQLAEHLLVLANALS